MFIGLTQNLSQVAFDETLPLNAFNRHLELRLGLDACGHIEEPFCQPKAIKYIIL
jgi:hypothetical protein